MPRTSEMIESKYLRQADVPDPLIVTIEAVGQANIAREGDTPEWKWTATFHEFPNKPLILNSTNIKLLEKACGSDDTDDWAGREVVLYTDENVSFGGQIVGGLRIRKQQAAPQRRTAPKPVAAATTAADPFGDMDSDIPL